MRLKEYKARLNDSRRPYMVEHGDGYVIDGRRKFSDPGSISNLFGDEIGLRQAAEEFVYVLCLDTKCHATGLFQASHGSVNESMFPIREIFQKSLLLGAVSIVLIHNHPSGDCTPSKADIASTKRAKEAGKIIGISVLDHIIIAGNEHFSFANNGII